MFEAIINAQFEKCKDVLIDKAKQYAGEGDRLHNFRCAAGMQCCSAKEALAGMMAKHTISIYDMCRDGKLHSEEMWNEKITDHINYLLLLRAIVTEDELHNNEEMMDFNQDLQKSEADDLVESWKELWHEIGEEERISGNT
jgi:hypothetical protein